MARDLFRARGSRFGLTLALQSAGFLAWRIGAYRKALPLYEESLSVAAAAGNPSAEAFAHNDIGLARLTLGELPAARRELERAITLWRQTGDVAGQGLSLHNLGKVFELGGDRERCLELYGQALAVFRRSGDRDAQARVLASIAQAEEASGRLDEALARIDQSLEILDAGAGRPRPPLYAARIWRCGRTPMPSRSIFWRGWMRNGPGRVLRPEPSRPVRGPAPARSSSL